jgi:hypothetical protein
VGRGTSVRFAALRIATGEVTSVMTAERILAKATHRQATRAGYL